MSKIIVPEDSPQTLKDLVARANVAESAKAEEDLERASTARERLMRHLNRETMRVYLSDPEDTPMDFVELRTLSPSEQQGLRDLEVEASLAGVPDEWKASPD